MGAFGRRGGAVVAGLAFAGSGLAWAPGASAGPRDANEQGKGRIVRRSVSESSADRGRERARAGDCAAAVDAFDTALRTTVDPTLHRDRGFCHEKLGNDFPAMEDYRAYLTAMPDAQDYEAVHDRLFALENNHGGDDMAAALSASNHAGTSSAYGEGVTISGVEGEKTSTSSSTAKGGGSAAALEVGFRDDEEPRLAKNSIFIEGFGPSLLYSINYDRMLSEHLSFRFGFGYFSFSGSSASVGPSGGSVSTTSGSVYAMFIPLMLNGLIGSGNHKAEIGGGATIVAVGGAFNFAGAGTSGSASAVTALPDVYLGYRYAPKDGGFNFRVGASLFVKLNDGVSLFPWPGISFGYGF